MKNNMTNEIKRQEVRRAILKGLSNYPEACDAKSIVADTIDAMAFRMGRNGDLKCDSEKLTNHILKMTPEEQTRAVVELEAMTKTYKQLFETVKAKTRYKGTFEDYIDEVSVVAGNEKPSTSMEDIAKSVLLK